MKNIGLYLIAIYRSVGSVWLGGTCRFEPSCSEYGAQAFREHTFLSALYLTARRVSKCRPGGGFGFDPVPQPHQTTCSRGHHHG